MTTEEMKGAAEAIEHCKTVIQKREANIREMQKSIDGLHQYIGYLRAQLPGAHMPKCEA